MDLMMDNFGNWLFHKMTARVACLLVLVSVHMPSQASERGHMPASVGLAGETMGSGFMIQFFAGLSVVLLCIIGLAWLMRRYSRLQSTAGGALRVVDGLALGARERIILVQVGDTQVLLGVAPGRVEAVHVLNEPVIIKGRNRPKAGDFSARLKEAFGVEKPS
jgi:flagellar protein FliO/FliZ